jgi:hypothetical protein
VPLGTPVCCFRIADSEYARASQDSVVPESMVGGDPFPLRIPAATQERVGEPSEGGRLMGAVTEEQELPLALEGDTETPARSFVSRSYAAYVLEAV